MQWVVYEDVMWECQEPNLVCLLKYRQTTFTILLFATNYLLFNHVHFSSWLGMIFPRWIHADYYYFFVFHMSGIGLKDLLPYHLTRNWYEAWLPSFALNPLICCFWTFSFLQSSGSQSPEFSKIIGSSIEIALDIMQFPQNSWVHLIRLMELRLFSFIRFYSAWSYSNSILFSLFMLFPILWTIWYF